MRSDKQTPPARKDDAPLVEEIEARLERQRERLRRSRRRSAPKQIGEVLRKILREGHESQSRS